MMPRPTPSPVPNLRARLLGAVLFLSAGVLAAPIPAQPAPGPGSPAEIADEFQRGFQSMAWAGLAQRFHPEALAYVRLAADIVIRADDTGWALENLGGGAADRAAWEALTDEQVFVRVMRWTQENAPGLLSSLVSRRSEVLGVVEEGADTAHAVYRLERLVQGAEPEVLVMTLLRTPAGWKVRHAPEVRSLHTAIRGIPIPR